MGVHGKRKSSTDRGSAIDGSEPTLFMGLYNFAVTDPITRQNWDVGSAKNIPIPIKGIGINLLL